MSSSTGSADSPAGSTPRWRPSKQAARSPAYLNPFTVPATDQVLGAILCSWEQTFEMEINAVMENLAAVSERTWTVQRQVSDKEFNEMYQSQRLRLGRLIQDR